MAAGTIQPLISPNGKVLAVINSGDPSINSYQLNTGGSLSPKSSLPTGATVDNLIFNLSGNCLYIGDNASGNGIWQYQVASDGTLTPSSVPKLNAGQFYSYPVLDPSQKFYVFQNHTNLAVFSEIAGCSLQEIAHSPFYIDSPGDYIRTSFTFDGLFGVISSLSTNVLYSFSFNPTTGQIAVVDHVSTATPGGFTVQNTIFSLPSN